MSALCRLTDVGTIRLRRCVTDRRLWVALAVLCSVSGLATGAEAVSEETPERGDVEATREEPQHLDFALEHNIGEDGASPRERFIKTKGWRPTEFTGSGAVRVEKDTVYLEKGNDLTGINWTGPLVRMNYEIALEAMRVEGEDFFCGLTFPVGEDPCSLIVGGWGGPVVGLSCLDYFDAYTNETARFVEFEKNRWYRIRLRVTEGRIEAWIDDDKLVDVETTGRKIGIRWEVEKSKPLGIACWRTTAALRKCRLRVLPADPAGTAEGP